jgi:hypothetical protein
MLLILTVLYLRIPINVKYCYQGLVKLTATFLTLQQTIDKSGDQSFITRLLSFGPRI